MNSDFIGKFFRDEKQAKGGGEGQNRPVETQKRKAKTDDARAKKIIVKKARRTIKQ